MKTSIKKYILRRLIIPMKKIDHYEKKFEKKIDKKWMDELALQTQVVIKDSKINYQHGRVLYSELSNYIAKNSPERFNNN